MDALPNLNHISHSDLPAFFREVFSVFQARPDHDPEQFDNGFIAEIAEFEALVNESVATDQDREIIRLDGEWYAKFDAVAEQIHDTMTARMDDPGHVLFDLDLKWDTAMQQMPEYQACNKLLVPLPDDPERGTLYRGYSCGQEWPADAMAEFIARQRDPSLRPHALKAGVAHLIDALIAADDRLHAALSAPGATITRERLDEIRKNRETIVNSLHLMFYRIPQYRERHKKPKRFLAHEVFKDRLMLQQEQSLYEEFSYNDISYTALAKIAQISRDQILKNDAVNEKIKNNFQKELSEYLSLLREFESGLSWRDLDDVETARLRDMERLLLSVTSHFGCIGADSKEVWARHEASDEYKAVNALFEDLDLQWFECMELFFRGQVTRPELHLEIIDSWDNPEHREQLKQLNCLDLYEECKAHEARSGLLAEKVGGANPNTNLDDLRESRFQLCLLLNIAESQMKKKPDEKKPPHDRE
ncbi:MAG: hypothetical protein JW768_02585 [Chitinispirillaceae bacterium]|nr:hypothetical protein [Chitinispirillaceae bacterium]